VAAGAVMVTLVCLLTHLSQVISSDPYLTAIFGNPQAAYPGASINTLVPPTIYWEKTVSTDFGLEGGFLNNKLTFEADYYNRKHRMPYLLYLSRVL
jgi:hypothetical protein